MRMCEQLFNRLLYIYTVHVSVLLHVLGSHGDVNIDRNQ